MKKAVAALLMVFLLTSCSNSISAKPNNFTDNGAVVSWKGMPFYSTGNLYYETLTYEDGGFYRLNDGFEKLSDIGGNRLWSYNGMAYFNTNPWIDITSAIYRVSISVYSSPEKLMDGELNFVSNSGLMCWTDNRNIYTADIYGSNKKLVASGGNYLNFHNNIVYYSTNENDVRPSSVSLFAYNIITEETTELATHAPDLERPLVYLQIPQLEVVGDRVVYSVGDYMGSGHYFTGEIISMRKDGSKSKEIHSIEHTNFDEFHKFKDKIIYQQILGEVKLITVKDDKEKTLDKKVNRFVKAYDDYIYYQAENGDLYRCNTNFKDDNLIVKATSLPNEFRKEGDHLIFKSLDIIDNTLYFTADVWGYRVSYGWRNQLLNRVFGQVDIIKTDEDETNLKIHLHIISDAQNETEIIE